MSKRWFTPSFEPSVSASTEKGPSSKQRKTKSTRSDQRKTSSAEQRTARVNGTVGVDLLSKYEPQTPDDLVVHVKKIDQVRTWIRDRITNATKVDGKYVLLHGPSGSGKSTTFRVLAKSLNVKIIEWITPLDRECLPDDGDREDGGRDYDDDARYFRGGESLDSFLWRASRYGCLGTLDGLQPCLKIVLVKDFPNSFVHNAQSFHDLLRKYRDYSTYPVAFVCNDDAINRRLFPDNIRQECRVHEIAFNPVNCTGLTKALKRVLEMERRLNPTLVTALPNDVTLQSFHQQSAGDLRCALLKFYFSIIKPSPAPSLTQASIEMTTATQTSSASNGSSASVVSTINDRGGLDLFKILGRVLYSKTECSTTDGDYKFVHDPDQLVKNMTDQPSMFTSFLQENYVSRFQDVLSIAAVADTFCVADSMFNQHNCYKNATSDGLALSAVVRRLMSSNRRPKKSFAPFVKPKVYDSTETFAARFSRTLRSISPDSHFSSRELVLHVLPFAKSIPLSSEIQQCLKQFANTDGSMLRVKRES